ncbi:MAG: putative Ig domain-containing protein, partial [Pseudomonadota bacterium]
MKRPESGRILRTGMGLLALAFLLMGGPAWAGSSKTSLDVETSGEILAGQELVFDLNDLPVGQRVYIERTAGTNVNQLNWTLEDLFGRVITQNLTQLSDLPAATLMGGDYRLTVRGETPTATGTFSFIAHDVQDTGSVLALDSIDTRSFTSIGATHQYDLPLMQPASLRLFFSVGSPNQLSYRITDALGNVRVDWTTSAPTVTSAIDLPAGQHLVEVRGRNGYSGQYSLQARPVMEPVPISLPLGGSATYSSTDVSEVNRFEFTLSENKRVYVNFDFSHTSNLGQWRLDRSDGAEIRDWSTSLNAPDEPLDLLAGTYQITVRSRSTGDITGDVLLFEVIDTTSALLLDTPARADIVTPGQSHRFSLSTLPSGEYLLDRTDSNNAAFFNWWIEDALGRIVLQRTLNTNDIESIPLAGGDYTLVVTGEGAFLGFVEFTLVTRTLIQSPTTLGSVISDAIVTPGESREYSFTVPANQQLAIERQASSNFGALNYILRDAVGREVVGRTANLPNLLERSLVGGDYTLTVLGEGGTTASYTLALNDNGISGFAPTGTPIALDVEAQSSINSGETQQWLLTVPTDRRVYFQLNQGSGNLTWTLLDASGQTLFNNQRAQFAGTDDRGPYLLAAGDYTVEFSRGGSGSSNYAFQANEVAVTESIVNLDQLIDSPVNLSGFRNDYLFTVPTDGRHYFQLFAGGSQLRWTLETLEGERVFGPSRAQFSSDSLGAYDLLAGDYRLIFEATAAGTPFYQFQIRTVNDLTANLSLGASPVPVTGTMAVPGQRHDYALTVQSGVEQLYVQVNSGNSALRYSLLDASGREVISPSRLQLALNDNSGPLPVQPGAYRLLISMVNPTTSAYDLTLHAPSNPAALQTSIDQTEAWTPPGAGTAQRYTFNLKSASSRILFEPLVTANNAFATLRHMPSGWEPFADVNLNSLVNAVRGPFSLPAGEYELEIRSLLGQGQPSWRLSTVTDLDAGPIAVDEVVIAEFPSRGARLSYTVQPEQDGQALLFDLMFPADFNQWELIDPVGRRVFGPVNAASVNTHDRGPFALADGLYELVFTNTRSNTPEWLFQVASAGETIVLPEGCAACSALDVVFTFDTSPSMNPVNQTMCDITAELVQALADDGIPINSRFWGIAGLGEATCLTSDITTELGTVIPGTPPPFMTTLDQCDDGFNGAIENWGPAVAVVADQLAWDPEAVRLVIPVADEGSYCGSPVNDFDIESVFYARQIAAQNNVVVSPLLPSIAPDEVRAMAGLITVGTGGISTVADFDLGDVLPVARSIALAACGSAQVVAAPEFTDVSPLPGTLLPSGVPIVLSGRVLPVNRLRPVLEVEVNGQPSSVLDGSGAFFATIELQPGPNRVTISAVEACGPTVLEIELMGAGDDSDPWASYAEVTDLLQGEFSNTTFDQTSQRLLVDVAVHNPGAALRGPILMAVGVDLDPSVSLLNADGLTPNGEPYVVLVPEGSALPANSSSPIRELAFANPSLNPIDFQPRWILPANQAPNFTTIPATRATVGRPWQYAANADDGDGDSVTYALLTAPAGMSLNAGQLSWTPAVAGSFDVVLRASDGRGGVSRQSFSINVAEVGFNTPPFFTSTPVIQGPIGGDYGSATTVVDPDGDSVSFSLLSAPAGLAVDPVSGLLTWPNAQPGQHSVIIQADDGQGGLATQSFTLFIGEPATTPPGPSFVSTPIAFAAVGTQYRYRFRVSPPQEPAPNFVLAQGPPAMVLDPVEGSLIWVPEAGDLGPHVIELVATDASGLQASQRFVLTVLDNLPNQAPYITTTPPLFAVVGQPWSYGAEAVDPEFDDLTYSVSTAPVDLTIDPFSGQMDWTPPPGTPASVPITLVVTDAEGLSAEQAFDVVVRPGNAIPTLDSTPPAAVLVGQTYNHLFIANDADGDTLTFSLVNGPTGMNLDSEAGWLSWPTTGVTPGSYDFEIELADDWGGRVNVLFAVTVVADLEAPSVNIFIERQPACATESVTVCLQASDNVGIASRELLIDGQPQSLLANCVDWTPSTPGNVPASASATDVSGLTAFGSRSLQVADCNDDQKPVVELFSPDIDGLLLRPTPLVVSIDDNTPAALTWEVAIRAGLEGVPQMLAQGAGPVDQSEVALIDPTVLPEGEYWVSILGSDGLQTGGIEFRINIGGGFKPGRVRSATADVIMPLAGTPLTIGRSYDSLDAGVHGATGGDLGPGWRLYLSGSVQDSVRETSDPDSPLAAMLAEPFNVGTRVVVTKPDGERVGFTFEPVQRGFPASFQFEVEFEPDKGVEDELRVVDGPPVVSNFGNGFADYIIPYNPSVYELETPEKVVYVISEEEGLIEVRDALGGTLTIDDDGIVSSTGQSIDYVRDAQGRVVEVRVPPAVMGEQPGRILYGYGALGNLETVTDLGDGVTTFQYGNTDYPHHVTAVIDPRGEILTQQIYDEEGRL